MKSRNPTLDAQLKMVRRDGRDLALVTMPPRMDALSMHAAMMAVRSRRWVGFNGPEERRRCVHGSEAYWLARCENFVERVGRRELRPFSESGGTPFCPGQYEVDDLVRMVNYLHHVHDSHFNYSPGVTAFFEAMIQLDVLRPVPVAGVAGSGAKLEVDLKIGHS